MSSAKEIQTIWEYLVRSETLSQFLDAYTPDGAWAQLFQKCPGYIKTELKRDPENPQRFITVDYWQSYADYSAIKKHITAEYELLDKQCEAYTISEKHIGIFETVENSPQN